MFADLKEFLEYLITALCNVANEISESEPKIALGEFRAAFYGVMLRLERRSITYNEVVECLRVFRTLYEVFRGYLANLLDVHVDKLAETAPYEGLGRFDIPKSVGRFLGSTTYEADKPSTVAVSASIARLIRSGQVAGVCDFVCEEVAAGDHRLALMGSADFCERPAPVPEHARTRRFALACRILRESAEYAEFRKQYAEGTRARIQKALASGDAEWVARARADHREAMAAYHRAAGKC